MSDISKCINKLLVNESESQSESPYLLSQGLLKYEIH